MQLRLFARVLPGVATASVISALALAVATTTSNQPSYAGNNKFFCTQQGNTPVTKVRTSRGPETFIRWVFNDFKKFPASERCQIVSQRFQRYYDNGPLFIKSEFNFNNYPVLCIANRRGVPCTADNVLVTLKPGSDPGVVLKQILDFRRGTKGETVGLSGSGKCRFYSEYEGDLYLDVKQLVDDKECG
ncbi:MAG: COP23 domain-containing protein [Nostoc sp. DedSLP03]|uniref:COP23 domain-containing protein n=1 Tax=Nostoc sp. DedSLP03 TaxID=3075400 RepID=UPI002AD1FB67|nr:COP23 domain-containing protein [Nostoc sp. DedSLP03]MDZ7965261.1 COP23 domain-containing protein [Nostoc sp. DedSLP03]